MEYLEKSAPFLAANWPVALGIAATTILGLAIAYCLTMGEKTAATPSSMKDAKKPAKKSTKQISDIDKGEHPLSEFDDEMPDPSSAPPLHEADTLHVPHKFERLSEEVMLQRAKEYYQLLNKRRSIRQFSSDPVPLEVINDIIRAAGTSPSGAHCEPWTFVVVRDKALKTQIREIVEQEEYQNYDRRMGDKWVTDLKFIQTNYEKAYLEEAPYIIIVMKQQYRIENGVRYAHYYYEISTAISAGILITAIQNAGLVTVTTTPLNATVALRELLGRPDNEKVMLLLPVGYPSQDATVPDIARKPLDDIMVLK